MTYKSLISCMIAAIALAVPAAAQNVKIALDAPANLETSGTYVWAHTFSEHLKANGMETELFERGALGNEAERLDQVSQGLLEVSMSDLKSAGQLDGTINAVHLPFFFTNEDEMYHALYEGGMLEKINEGTTPKGVRVGAVTLLGAMAGIFTTGAEVNTIGDMAALRFRALDETQIKIYDAWGTTGTIVSWGEVPNALQTGVADGYLNPPFVPLLYGHTGFIRTFSNARVIPSARTAIISEDWFQGLSAEERAVVDEAAFKATEANRDWLAGRTTVLDSLRNEGVTVTEMTDEDRNAFVRASEKVYSLVKMPEGALDAWVAAKGN